MCVCVCVCVCSLLCYVRSSSIKVYVVSVGMIGVWSYAVCVMMCVGVHGW